MKTDLNSFIAWGHGWIVGDEAVDGLGPEVVEDVKGGEAVAGATHVLEPPPGGAEGGAPRPAEDVHGRAGGRGVQDVLAGVECTLVEVVVHVIRDFFHHLASFT